MRQFNRAAMLSFLFGVACPAFAAPPPVEAFFQDAEFAYASMSPDGRAVAVRVGAPGVRTGLVVFDLATMTPRVVSRNPQSDVDMVWWVSEKRIAFSVVNIPPATIGSTNGLYAIDVDGSDPRGLDILGYRKRSFAQTNLFGGGSTSRGFLSGISPQLDDTMFIGVSDFGERLVQQRLDTRTAASSFVSSPFGTFEWLHDEARVMRVALAQEGKLHVLYDAGVDGKWRKVSWFDPKSDAAFLPYYFAKNVLYVRARKGGDRASIYRYNLATAMMEAEPIISSPEFDVEGYMLHDGKKMTGFSMQADADSTVWFDPAMKALQAEIDRMLPNTVNSISRGKRGDTPYVLVNAFAPTQTLLVLVYNRDTKKLTQLGSSMPQLSPAQLAGVDFVHYKSRDGLTLPSYLTLPPGADSNKDGKADRPVPMVLLVHGGPWARDGYGYNGGHQLLANRGYAVLSVNFRGSTGFGKDFVTASNLEWGRKMHDDLLDATDWAVAQGVTTPDKVAIMGGSYGGYATLAGLTMTPDKFACGVDIVGPSNLETLLKTIPPYWEAGKVQFYKRMGDPNTAEGLALLKERSPLYLADKIKVPLLIGQGANDPRVNVAESEQIVNAMKARNIPVTYVVFPDEGHGFARPVNNLAFFGITEQFLGKCLGGRAEELRDDIRKSTAKVEQGAALVPGLASASLR